MLYRQIAFNMDIITDDEEFQELVNIVRQPQKPRVYRERVDSFIIWDDQEFSDRYRLGKAVVEMLVNLIADEISSPTNWNHAVTAHEKVLITLRFFDTGNLLQVSGDFHGVHKSTASRIILQVSRALARRATNYISMPNNADERRTKVTEFYRISRFPKCIDAVDCTHVKIQSPGGPNAETFRNRKHFFSFNVQAVCDANLIIQDVVCRWPGSSHDSTIFNNSFLKAKFERGDYADCLLVGDSGYAVQNYLMTPLAQVHNQAVFNEAQIRTRNPIERCFGVWKRRFPIIALGIRLNVNRVEAVVMATAMLHNIARSMNLPDPQVDPEVEDAINQINNMANIQPIQGGRVNNVTRYAIINGHFAGI